MPAHDQDKLKLIARKKVAIIGYGNQGRSHALNCRDSGISDLVIGLRPESNHRQTATADGFTVLNLSQACEWANFIMLLTPDETHAEVYNNHIQPHLAAQDTLAFAHGLSIHYQLIHPPQECDIVMVAPKSPGDMVRHEYINGRGAPCLVAVNQDHTGHAEALALSYAHAIGADRAGIITTTFKDETEIDLFGEQAVIYGGLVELIRNGYDTLVEADYPDDIAYFEIVNELKLITNLIHQGGIAHMNQAISNTAEYGALISGPRIINKKTKKNMKAVLKDIKNGKFMKKWLREYQRGKKNLVKARTRARHHPIETVGKRIRLMQSWLSNK